jgi:MFS family permease
MPFFIETSTVRAAGRFDDRRFAGLSHSGLRRATASVLGELTDGQCRVTPSLARRRGRHHTCTEECATNRSRRPTAATDRVAPPGGAARRPEANLPRASPTALLLNVGHALDHLFLLIFASAVGAIGADWDMAWPDLMPYATGAFVAFGLGALPAGRLGDLWGRRSMMIVFFVGLGSSGLLVALSNDVLTLAAALTLLGVFASIYHPVGIPMLVERSARPGFTIGLNGLAGNLGIAGAAGFTGLFLGRFGWRAAFAAPSLVAFVCAGLFARLVPRESEPPARRVPRAVDLPPSLLARVFLVMAFSSVCGGLIFNFTTNGNGQLLAERMRGVVEDPAVLGALLAAVYTAASFAQLVVGTLIDRFPLKRVYLAVVAAQVPLFLIAARARGVGFYVSTLLFMVFVFGSIPFTDALIVRYVDDRMRSRVAGLRLTVSFGVSALAVFLLGPLVKASGFDTLLIVLAVIAAVSTLFVSMLPRGVTTLGPPEVAEPAA